MLKLLESSIRDVPYIVKEDQEFCLPPGHSNLSDWGLPIGLTLVVLGPWFAKLLDLETNKLHFFLALVSRNAWHISFVGICCFVLMMFWHSFCRFDLIEQRTKPRLGIEFIKQSPGAHRDLYASAFRVMVTNLSSERIENVGLVLTQIDSEDWPSPLPREVTSIRFPLRLPITVDSYKREYVPVFECGLNGGDKESFDLFLIGCEGTAMWYIALAPFTPPTDPNRHKWGSNNRFNARLAVNTEPRKRYTFIIKTSSNIGEPTSVSKTLLFPGWNEGGLNGWEGISHNQPALVSS